MAVRPHPLVQAEVDKVESWRIACFESIGFNRAVAELYDMEAIDWHELEHLLSEGCAPDVAARILAPL